MNCPHCGMKYEPNETICKGCHSPLSNATYVKIKKRRIWPFVLGMIIFILIFGGIFGYQYYLHYVEKRCREATDLAFRCAKKMDFSEIPKEYLPDILKDDPNVKDVVKDYLDKSLSESGLQTLLDGTDFNIDTDAICDEMVSQASYEITDVKTTYNSCTVTVHTKNLDYLSLPESVYKEAVSELSESDSLWQTVKEKISQFLFGSDEESEEQDDTDKLNDLIQEVYDNAKENCPSIESTGTICFGIKDKTWQVLSFDEEMFYVYYGIDRSRLSDQ